MTRPVATSASHPNFVFLNGYSDACAAALYGSGDLFVMPSSFEPCGISQMLAMRDGQLCLVHGVGGLKDTVNDGIDGFVFAGETAAEQVDAFALGCRRAVDLKSGNVSAWNDMRERAAAARFLWDHTVSSYVRDLYA